MSANLPPDGPAYGKLAFAKIYASLGRYREAADIVEKLPAGMFSPEQTEAAVRLLRTAPAKVPSPQNLPRLDQLGWVYLYIGAPDRVLDYFERNVDAGFNFGLTAQDLWYASYASIRKTERFKNYVRRAGYVDYWRAKGWPEFCHPTTGDDFACN